jgi:hypothetical protein
LLFIFLPQGGATGLARDDEQIYITYDGINHIAHTQTRVSQQ